MAWRSTREVFCGDGFDVTQGAGAPDEIRPFVQAPSLI